MFRRSNSSSNIPLRKANLFGTNRESRSTQGATASKRSQSSSRLSQKDEATTHHGRTLRKSSLERKSHTVGLQRTTPIPRAGSSAHSLLRTTPLTRAGSSAHSLQKTTPVTVISQRNTRSRGTTPLSCRQERNKVAIQKLAGDKKWVAEQYIKVQNFITENPDIFDQTYVNPNNIKPPTINIFIYVTEMLLFEIFPKIKIRVENYKEVIPAQLKVLRYPGTLAGSTLKTVNTMHSWPQVIGMWSWLIDKVKLGRQSEDTSFIDHLDPEKRQQYLLNQNCRAFLIERYTIFNRDNADSAEADVQNAKEKYLKNTAEILEVDFEKYQQLQQDIADKRKYRDKQIAESELLKAKMLSMQTGIDEMKNEIQDFQDGADIEENELDSELQQIQLDVRKLKDTLIATKENINNLKEAIKVQPCTYQEKLLLLRQMDELKGEIKVKKEKLEHAKEIKNKFDHQLTSEISKIQANAIQWNRSLMELCIQEPELKKLLLREKGFHDPQFLNELKEVLGHKVLIENEVKEKLVKVVGDLKMQLQKKQEIERDIEELTVAVEHTNRECVRIEEDLSKLRREIKDIETDLEQTKRSHLEHIKRLQEEANSKDQAKLIAELKEKKENLDVEVKKFGQKTISFFVEMQNQVINNIKEMDAIKMNVARNIEEKVSATLEKQKFLLETLKSVKSGNKESS